MAFYRAGLSGRVTEMATEGLGVAGGFIAGGILGRQVENLIVPVPVTAGDSIGKKILAVAANNVPKIIAHGLMHKYDATSEGGRDATKALMGSVAYDVLLRIANKGVNPASVELGGYRVLGNGSGLDQGTTQRLIQENSILRTELNKAMQKLASGYSAGQKQPAPVMALPNSTPNSMPGGVGPGGVGPGGDFKYGGSTSPAVEQRQRKYGAMPWTPDVMERERRFGAMPFQQDPVKTSREKKFGFMTYPSETPLSVFGMQ
jgi:hypothetical protein